MEKYAVIIDKGECLSTINGTDTINSNFPWKDKRIMKLAGKSEWTKHNFYPANDMVGKIVDIFSINNTWNIFAGSSNDIYILLIDNTFYVPMSKKGIQFIDYQTFENTQEANKLRGIPTPVTDLHNRHDDFWLQSFREQADDYLYVAINAINHFINNDINFVNMLKIEIASAKSNPFFNIIDWEALCEQIIPESTKEAVMAKGHTWNNLQSVSLNLGIMCYIMEQSVNTCHDKFNDLFISSWNYYFSLDRS